MPPLIECIPNFSEGRDPAILHALLESVTSVPGVWLLHHTMDADHHRSVLTFAGSPDAVCEAALRAITVATESIDLRNHDGVHPRIGATDVVPFIPLRDVSMEDCVRVARSLGQEVGAGLGIPVFFYEHAASSPARKQLESIRLGGLQGLASRMECDQGWLPDFGPSHLHISAGAIVIGARQPLIAFNANLRTNDLSVAKSIARSIRHSNGGLPCLKAIGVELASRGMVQVAMNLTDHQATSMQTAFEAVKTEAHKYGVAVAGTELVGLVPQAALDQAAVASLHFERFDPTQVLERRLAEALLGKHETDPTLSEFITAVAEAAPTPAGGSVAALVGALAASLGVMGQRLGHHPELTQALTRLRDRFHQLVHDDARAYRRLLDARKTPKHDPDRQQSVSDALHQATLIPLEIAESACEAGRAIHAARPSAPPAVRGDLTIGIIMSIAAAEAGLCLARINAKEQLNQQLIDLLQPRFTKAERSLEELKGLCYTPPPVT